MQPRSFSRRAPPRSWPGRWAAASVALAILLATVSPPQASAAAAATAAGAGPQQPAPLLSIAGAQSPPAQPAAGGGGNAAAGSARAQDLLSQLKQQPQQGPAQRPPALLPVSDGAAAAVAQAPQPLLAAAPAARLAQAPRASASPPPASPLRVRVGGSAARPTGQRVTPLPAGKQRVCIFGAQALPSFPRCAGSPTARRRRRHAAAAVPGATVTTIPLLPRPSFADFDDTIKVGHGDVGRDSRWVIRECLRRGYGIGVATAGCQMNYVHNWLRRFDPAVFTGAQSSLALAPAAACDDLSCAALAGRVRGSEEEARQLTITVRRARPDAGGQTRS